ncbi:MAG: GAF domain-containing protein [Halobacteria archaeon]|nr:GAF domain-containing protein [Halobacteria archaeon]
MNKEDLDKKVRNLAETTEDVDVFSEKTVSYVSEYSPEYDWVGIYLVEDDLLKLRPTYYVGSEPEHKEIPFDEGICGASARSRETIIVDDVNEDPRYLACSIHTQSEIVVPIQKDGKLYGVLDLDSHTHAAFDHEDRELLEKIAERIAEFYEREGVKSITELSAEKAD